MRASRSEVRRPDRSPGPAPTPPRRAPTPKESTDDHWQSSWAEAPADRGDELGPDHPHHREPRRLHEDRLREPGRDRMPQHVVAVPRLLGVHERQGPARRRLHHQPDLRHLRGQPHHLLGVRAEHGLRHHAATAGGEHHQSRRGRRVHVRSHDLPGQPGVRGLLRGHGQADQPERAGPRGEHRGAPRRAARLPHDRGHHALVQPVRRRVLPAGVEGVPDDPGDVLPDGGPPRAPVHGLSGRGGHDARTDAVHRLRLAAGRHPGLHQALRRDERRHLRLLLRGTARLRGGGQAAHPARLLGRIPELGRLRLPLRDDERLGQGDVRHAGRRGRRRSS